MDFMMEQPIARVIGYDWKGDKIYEHENYYVFKGGFKVREDPDEIINFSKSFQKEHLFTILLNDYDYAFSKDELADVLTGTCEFHVENLKKL